MLLLTSCLFHFPLSHPFIAQSYTNQILLPPRLKNTGWLPSAYRTVFISAPSFKVLHNPAPSHLSYLSLAMLVTRLFTSCVYVPSICYFLSVPCLFLSFPSLMYHSFSRPGQIWLPVWRLNWFKPENTMSMASSSVLPQPFAYASTSH